MSTAQKLKQVSDQINGSFENEEAVTAFLTPIKDLLSTSPSIILKFDTDNIIRVNAMSKGREVVTIMEFNESVLEGFNVPKEVKFGISDLAEFYNLTKLFSHGFDFNVTDKRALLESEGQKFNYRACEIDLIKEGPQTIDTKKLKWFSEFKWDNDIFMNFKKALGILRHNHIIFEGKKDEKTMKLHISDINMAISSSSYEMVLDLVDPNEDDFHVAVNKDSFIPLITSSISDLTVQISDRLVHMYGSGESHKVKYYLSTCS